MNWILKLFVKKNKLKTDTKREFSQFQEAFIRGVYNKREKEIESLLQYDKGEKNINPRNLESVK